MTDKIIKACNEAQYRYLESVIKNKLDDTFKQEYDQYSEFLIEANISVLPDNYYKDGKVMSYKEVRKLYDEWQIKNNKNDI